MLPIQFADLGFNPTHFQVYTALAELGKAGATQIARQSVLPRSTVYSALEGLIEKGLVSLDQTSKTRQFIANAPTALKRLFERERDESIRQLKNQEVRIDGLIEQLLPFFKSQHYSIPRIQFFEGTSNVEAMLYEHSSEWRRSLANYDFTWWGYQDHHFVETYRTWLDGAWNSMDPKERIMLLSNKSSVEKRLQGKVTRREIRIVPKEFEFSSTIWVLGDYIISIMTRQKPHYAFQLRDAVFAANLRKLFQLLWSQHGNPATPATKQLKK